MNRQYRGLTKEGEWRKEISYTAESPDPEKPNWKIQHYIKTIIPNRKGSKGWYITNGYIMRKVRNHPHTDKRGYIQEHRLIMEKQLGRFLIPRQELVHHIDGDKSNNKLSNLKLISPIEHPKCHIVGKRNPNGQFVAKDPIFQEIKFRLYNRDSKLTRIYTLSELIGTAFHRGQFEFRGRFTGLKDKNGREIYYDSDIVKYTYIVYNDYGEYEDTIVGTVVLDLKFTNSLCIKHKGGSMYHFTASKCGNLEIIGNIHQNPEPLKQ